MQDNPLLFDFNVEQRVSDFIAAAMTQVNSEFISIITKRKTEKRLKKKKGHSNEEFVFCSYGFDAQANVTRTNHIMWTMGDDFQYQYAESWFKQMDKLIHYVNQVVIYSYWNKLLVLILS